MREYYEWNVLKLFCFLDDKTIATALDVLTEIGDCKRFAAAGHFAFHIGLMPEKIHVVTARIDWASL